MNGQGINWGLEPIGDGWRKKFSARKRFNTSDARIKANDTYTTVTATLSGLAFDAPTLADMLTIADNGHRWIFVVSRESAIGTVYGIYIY